MEHFFLPFYLYQNIRACHKPALGAENNIVKSRDPLKMFANIGPEHDDVVVRRIPQVNLPTELWQCPWPSKWIKDI